MVDAIEERDQCGSDRVRSHTARVNEHGAAPVVGDRLHRIPGGVSAKHDVDDPLGGVAVIPRDELRLHCPIVRGHVAVDAHSIEFVHRNCELLHRVDHRARPLGRRDVQAPIPGIVREVRSEEEDGAAGCEEVEEDTRVVGDQHIGDTEDHIRGDLIRD